ncbi:MAG: UDP-glucose--hexose-1-phosphate uridylyltransferase [Ruminococcaceae bacterium]|nr:UDP-glucose--hexose-1-phosphate uridylyltransferase [Oscillospiraceae bacterium]
MDINSAIKALVCYAEEKGLSVKEDRTYLINQLLAVLKLDSFKDDGIEYKDVVLQPVLDTVLTDAVARGVIEDSPTYRDLFDTSVMGVLTPRPSEVIRNFNTLYKEDPKKATDWYYDFSRSTDYIRTERVKKDLKWKTETKYGELDITVNLSKPEKDPKAIAAAKSMPQAGYPSCMLCRENEGYAGRVNHPARQNHRIIPMTLAGEDWCLQYSPYVYYNEHCIVFKASHSPMSITPKTFERLLAFVERFPHYFIGSNADLPIVGGSILTHDHFQGGCYEFPMAKADIKIPVTFQGFESTECGIVNWPMSVLRLRDTDPKVLTALATKILATWRGYTDEEAFVYAETDGVPHNTITPIARFKNGKFELDLVLRNNITTPEHPDGLYHPHAELHHIKKENIGLIEVMGLAVLPARLKVELAFLQHCIENGEELEASPATYHHAEWANAFLPKYEGLKGQALTDAIRKEVGLVFGEVLCHAGIYKDSEEGNAAFLRFVDAVNAVK